MIPNVSNALKVIQAQCDLADPEVKSAVETLHKCVNTSYKLCDISGFTHCVQSMIAADKYPDIAARRAVEDCLETLKTYIIF